MVVRLAVAAAAAVEEGEEEEEMVSVEWETAWAEATSCVSPKILRMETKATFANFEIGHEHQQSL